MRFRNRSNAIAISAGANKLLLFRLHSSIDRTHTCVVAMWGLCTVCVCVWVCVSGRSANTAGRHLVLHSLIHVLQSRHSHISALD